MSLKAFNSGLKEFMESGKLSSSDSGMETNLQDAGIAPVEGLEARIKKLEGMIEQMVNKAQEGDPVSLLAEAKNETNIRDAGRAGEGMGGMRVGGAPGDDRDQRKLMSIAVLKRLA